MNNLKKNIFYCKCQTIHSSIIVLLYFILFNKFISTLDRSYSACFYPHYSDRRMCNIHNVNLLNGWICDPDNTISMSEVHVIDDTLRRIYAQNSQNCQCSMSKKKPCWYKFAFAFLKELLLPSFEFENQNHCGKNFTTNVPLQNSIINENEKKKNYNSLNAEAAFLHAQNYVRVLRENWNIGECGEDILILVVQTPPKSLLSKQAVKSALFQYSLPMIFVSYGSHTIKQFENTNTYTLPYVLKPLRQIVDEENLNLLNTYPLTKVLNNFVIKTVAALQKNNTKVHNEYRPKSHIPFWAWLTFAFCCILFFLMFIGLYLIKTTTRRATQRGKILNDPTRRWKAGLLGDDPPPTTYVNLVNLMMPRPQNNVSKQ